MFVSFTDVEYSFVIVPSADMGRALSFKESSEVLRVESMTRFLHSHAVDVRTGSVGVTSHWLCKWLRASLS